MAKSPKMIKTFHTALDGTRSVTERVQTDAEAAADARNDTIKRFRAARKAGTLTPKIIADALAAWMGEDVR